tara:strand:- start:1571 stop:1843 length:273 start_codon:yes stop_codon:yes gene_type:complete
MLEDGASAVWQLRVEQSIDVYMCEEHHSITVIKRDGIWQIVHWAIWGSQIDLNYLGGTVNSGEMKLQLLEFDVEHGGVYIGDHPHRNPQD